MNRPVSVPQHPERIAVFRALYLGDLLVAVPALRALRALFPQAEITLIGLPWATAFVSRYPRYVDRLVVFPGYPNIEDRGASSEEIARFLAEQQAYHYDLIIQMHGSGKTSNSLVKQLKGKVSAGYYDESRPELLPITAPYPQGQHEILRNLGLVALLGQFDWDLQLEFPLHATDEAEIAALLAQVSGSTKTSNGHLEHTRLIGIHPGSRSPARRWPPAYFATVADELARRLNAHIVLTGSADEQATVSEVLHYIHVPALNLCGCTSLGGLAALINRLTLFVSNDTGPVHIACATRCPSITLFGPAEYSRWAPLDHTLHPAIRRPVMCSPCGYWECPIDHRCLRWLTPDRVLTVAERLLHETTQNFDMAHTR
ncbi:MAG TPA: glycosyltransferase family 9 protein [Ktedonobacteraceae bacterium]